MKGKQWTPAEIKILLENYYQEGQIETQKALEKEGYKRTLKAIDNKVYALDIAGHKQKRAEVRLLVQKYKKRVRDMGRPDQNIQTLLQIRPLNFQMNDKEIAHWFFPNHYKT